MNFKGAYYNGKPKRRQALLLIIGITILLLLIGRMMSDFNSQEQLDSKQRKTLRQSEQTRQGKKYSEVSLANLPSASAERFPFDPNTADSTVLRRLGFQAWQIRNIYKYRAKGGIYREPSDVARIYGVTRKQYRELLPYIRISDDYLPAADLVGKRVRQDSVRTDSLRYPVKLKADEKVNLNTTDTAELKRIPGVGSYYARRISSYGKRLGGYTSASQLAEIEGLPDSVRRYVTVEKGTVRKLQVNKMTLKQLSSHPYINFYQARAIIEARRLNGFFKSADELSFLPEFTEDDIRRLLPYLEF